MKSKNSLQPSKLWYVTSIEDSKEVQEKGIYNLRRGIKLIHKLDFGIWPLEGSEPFSSSDYFAISEVKSIKNLQYAILEIDVLCLENKLKRCHTEGIVVSECTYMTDVRHIEPQYILGCEIRTIDLDKLMYLNEWRLRNAMNNVLIDNENAECTLKSKEEALYKIKLKERNSAICLNTQLFNLVYGNYHAGFFMSSTSESEKLGNVA